MIKLNANDLACAFAKNFKAKPNKLQLQLDSCLFKANKTPEQIYSGAFTFFQFKNFNDRDTSFQKKNL